MAHLPPQWRERLLAVVGGKLTSENLRFLQAWADAEGGTAQWNPLNTTYHLYGSSDYNSVGVQNYKRATEGVNATALTLVNGYYNGILGALQKGTDPAEKIVADHVAELQTWGTTPSVISNRLAEIGPQAVVDYWNVSAPLKLQIAELSAKVDTANATIVDLQAKNTALQDQVAGLEEQATDLQAQIATLQGIAAKYNAALVAAKTTIDEVLT